MSESGEGNGGSLPLSAPVAKEDSFSVKKLLFEPKNNNEYFYIQIDVRRSD